MDTGYERSTSRRIRGGDELARALLGSADPMSFDELLAAAPASTPGEVAAWVGHAIDEGLLWETEPTPGHELRFSLRARGRRLLGAGRRAAERPRS
jgi:hypothetical protein